MLKRKLVGNFIFVHRADYPSQTAALVTSLDPAALMRVCVSNTALPQGSKENVCFLCIIYGIENAFSYKLLWTVHFFAMQLETRGSLTFGRTWALAQPCGLYSLLLFTVRVSEAL